MQKDIWGKEWKEGGQDVPASHRPEASKSLRRFKQVLGDRGFDFNGKRFLDIGCGNGRNGLYLAELGSHVTGIDVSAIALEEFERAAIERGVKDNIRALQASFDETFPFPDKPFDGVIDVASSIHIPEEEKVVQYSRETARVIKKDGYFLIYFFTENDGFVKKHFKGGSSFVNPYNGVVYRVYSADGIKQGLPDFKEIDRKHWPFEDRMYGEDIKRDMYSLIFQRI